MERGGRRRRHGSYREGHPMIEGLLLLLLCQLVGTLISSTLHLPIPGAVLGMLLLLGLLAWRRPAEDAPVVATGHRLLEHLPLLFIPAGVGVVAVLGLIQDHWALMLVGLVLPWLLGLVVTAGVAAPLARRSAGQGEAQ